MERLPKLAKLTASQEQAMIEGRMAFMDDCPFFAHYYWEMLREYPTYDMPTAATDGRRVFYNPAYLEKLTPLERCFVLAHETYHAIWEHCVRSKNYKQDGKLRGLPYEHGSFNVAADYVINANLIKLKIGSCNPEWLYAPDVKGDEMPEDVYVKKWKNPPPPPPGGQPGNQPGNTGGQPGVGNNTYGQVKKGTNPDKEARSQGGRFDEVLEPFIDPVSGAEDIPGEAEFKEAVARAQSAAKAIGKMPGEFSSMIEEILTPQVSWIEHVRMLVTGKIGRQAETWNTPNRKYLPFGAPYPAQPPLIYLPSKRGYGCDHVVCAIDSSGSVGDREIAAFMAEVGAVLADCKPRRVTLIWCDKVIQRVDTATNLDDLSDIRAKGAPGRGGTRFEPPFEYVEREGIRPDTFIYLTDLEGHFPKKPHYPVVWCATGSKKAPWGDTVHVRV